MLVPSTFPVCVTLNTHTSKQKHTIAIYKGIFIFLQYVHESYQRVEIVADQGSVVDDVSLEDNKEEEESQHHVAEVTEDVVECTA